MHIAWVHRGMYPEHIGGTYTYIYELGRRLVARGHRVDVISRALSEENAGTASIDGVGVHRYTYRRVNPIYSTYQHLNRCYDIFQRLAAESSIDILGIHDTHLGLKLAQSPTGRSICQVPTYHAPSFLEYRFNTSWEIQAARSPLRRMLLRLVEPPIERMQWTFERGVLNAASGIVVLSDFTRQMILENFPGIDAGRIEIVPSGVDTDRFAPSEDKATVRRDLGMDTEAVQLLTVRKLAPRMGLENLLRALRSVLDADAPGARPVHLTVCGGGALMPVLQNLVSELGLEGAVNLAGHVLDQDLVRYYQAADLFVLPTAALEGFGISTIEALSANLPVVGTPAGATPEILGQIDGRLLTRDTSAEAIADAVCSWLRWREEDPHTTRYRDFVLANYSWEVVTSAIESYYLARSEAFRRGADA